MREKNEKGKTEKNQIQLAVFSEKKIPLFFFFFSAFLFVMLKWMTFLGENSLPERHFQKQEKEENESKWQCQEVEPTHPKTNMSSNREIEGRPRRVGKQNVGRTKREEKQRVFFSLHFLPIQVHSATGGGDGGGGRTRNQRTLCLYYKRKWKFFQVNCDSTCCFIRQISSDFRIQTAFSG